MTKVPRHVLANNLDVPITGLPAFEVANHLLGPA
jgi:hypothetical protein